MIQFLDISKITGLYQEEIHEAVNRVVDSGWYLQGRENASFEKNYAAYIGTNHCVGTGNGFDALYLIYRAYIEMGMMQAGDEVIVPANTYIASILAITENGLKPVLIEPKLNTLEIDDEAIEHVLTNRTKSIMIVHLYGRCAYTNKIGELCKRYGLKLVEDNAQAHGCKFESQYTGALGDAAGHSFYPTKNLGAMGDGGAVTTNDKTLAEVIRAMGNYGSETKNVFRYQGRNSRLDEVQAAILNVKLRHLDDANNRRREVACLYIEGIKNPRVKLPDVLPEEQNVYHIFPVLCASRDRLQSYLLGKGIQTMVHYPIPPHQQTCMKAWNHRSFPITELIHQQELSLPMSQVLRDDEVQNVIEVINSQCL